MRRREFIAGLGGAATWPVVARAQQSAVPVIGWVGTGSPGLFSFKPRFAAFQQGLKEAGYTDGRNVAIEFRCAEGKFDRFPMLMAEMVARRVNVIAAMAGTPLAQAAKAATTTIPIVFYVGVDPVRSGLVSSLDRPGGNLTGVTSLSADVAPKRLELLRELLPALRRVALLVNSASPANVEVLTADTQEAARTLGLDLVVLKASSDPELDAVFANWQQTRAEALVIGTDSFFSNRTLELGRLVLRHGVPAVFEYPEFAASGGLMSYGTDIVDQFRQAGTNSQWRKASRPAGSANHEGRVGYQPQDRQGARPHLPTLAARPRRRGDRMKRREFIAGLGGAVTWPLVARAQQPAMPVIGYLSATSPESMTKLLAAFHQGLGETGFVDGQNVVIEYRWAHDQYDSLPMLATELAGRPVRVIVVPGATPAALAAKAATGKIPIVFTNGSDPVQVGLVDSLNRPGGNVTGIVTISVSLVAKRLALLHEVAPNASVVGFLVNSNSTNFDIQKQEVRAAASTLGLRLHVETATGESDLESAFAGLVQHGVGALIVSPDTIFNSNRDRLVALAMRYRVPAIYGFREHVAAGGLMSYGANLFDINRQIGVYAGRILNREKPANLPVMQPTKFELAIHLKTAKALGLTVPNTLLVSADEVIE